jgi:predicted lipid-binding transport protein (Tim44 family)
MEKVQPRLSAMPNSQFLDILLIAMVAGIVLFRLYTVLGRRTGSERPPQDRYGLGAPSKPSTAKPSTGGDNVVVLPARTEAAAERPADPIARGLLDIKQADRDFDADHFLAGARAAYETIVTAFAAGDRAALKPLLSDDVFKAFDAVIGGREERKEKVEFTFVGFKELKISEAVMKGRMADITVSISAQFISATLNANGAVTDGDPKSVREVTDVWSFARDVRSSDPNWALVATSGGEI